MSIQPEATAFITKSILFFASNLLISRRRKVSTVFSVTFKLEAISSVLIPWAMALNTSSSRLVGLSLACIRAELR